MHWDINCYNPPGNRATDYNAKGWESTWMQKAVVKTILHSKRECAYGNQNLKNVLAGP